MATSPEPDPLIARFRRPDLSRLVERLAARLRRGRSLRGTLRLAAPSDQERRAIAGLSGCSVAGQKAVSVNLDALAIVATRDGYFPSLAAFIEAVHGSPIAFEVTQRDAERQAWNNVWQHASQCAEREPALQHWLNSPRAQSWIRRLAAGDLEQTQRLLQRMFGVIDGLPSREPLLLAQLAAETCGDSHALDRDTPLGRLTLRSLAARAKCIRPRAAREIRTLWASAGIVLDELSATVLALNLPAQPGTPLGDVLHRLRVAGEPVRLTFRQLLGESPCDFCVAECPEVFVCENPAVLAAAANRWGAASRPLVCVEGQPNLAADRLLQMLVEHGISLRYHGDFDWGGIRIAARLWEKFGFAPWRFNCDDYLHAPGGRSMSGKPVAAPWDEELAPAMQRSGTVVHEEAVLDALLGDLGPEHQR